MAHVLEYILKLRDRVSTHLDKINKNAEKTTSLFSKMTDQLTQAVPALNLLRNPLAYVATGLYKLNGYVQEGSSLSARLSLDTRRLATTMRNTMGATDDQVRSILDLTIAQEQLGVVSRATQVAGANVMAAFTNETQAVRDLIPAMNDVIATRYGVNASQTESIRVGRAFGQLLNGSTSSLSKFGVMFTEAQERILQYGTQAEKAALISKVVTETLGGMNEAMAETPEGKLINSANASASLQERIGGIWNRIKATWIEVGDSVDDVIERIVVFLESHLDDIMAVVTLVAKGISGVINGLSRGFGWLFEKLRDTNSVFSQVAQFIGLMTAAWILYNAYTKIAAVVTRLMTGSVLKLNLAFLANPVFWIIAGIVALVAAVVVCWNKFEGFRKVVMGVWEVIKGFGQAIKDYVINRFKELLSGITGLGKALMHFFKGEWKEAWETGKDAVIDLTGAKSKAQLIRDGVDAVKSYSEGAKKGAEMGAISLSGLKNKILPGGVPGMELGGLGADKGGGGGGGKTLQSQSDIATGGTKNTTVNISIGKQIEKIVLNARDVKEGAKQIGDIILEEITRAVAMGASLGS